MHYAAAGGAITSFIDRVFYADLVVGRQSFYLKPSAAVISARRAGTTATFDQLNKYFTISQMPIISSRYWNMVHGANLEDVKKKDLEGLQTSARACNEYGMVSEVQRCWHKGRHTAPREGRNHLYQFY